MESTAKERQGRKITIIVDDIRNPPNFMVTGIRRLPCSRRIYPYPLVDRHCGADIPVYRRSTRRHGGVTLWPDFASEKVSGKVSGASGRTLSAIPF